MFFILPLPSVRPAADDQTDSAQKDQRHIAKVQLASVDTLHNGALVFRNPGAPGIEDADPEQSKSPAKENQDIQAAKESGQGEAGKGGTCLSTKQGASGYQFYRLCFDPAGD